MSHIGDLIEAYQDKHGTSDRALGGRIHVSATLIGRWKKGRFAEVPNVERIHALADQMNLDRQLVLNAFLRDLRYIPEESDGNDRSAAPMNVTELSAPPTTVPDGDLAGLPSVAHKPRKRGEPKD